jgi:hypothetical protein
MIVACAVWVVGVRSFCGDVVLLFFCFFVSLLINLFQSF